MKYWVYINDKVDGPYDETKLVTLNGFSQDTLICSEEVASAGGQEWVKASSIFEFDEIPVDSVPQNATEQIKTQEQNSVVDAQTNALLAKLESLTAGMSQLTNKLNSMQTHLDQALEQNKQLAQQVSQLQNPQPLPEEALHTPDAKLNTITLISDNVVASEQSITSKEANQDSPVQQDFPEQADPKEEELIIRSALDSIYGEKNSESTDDEEAFQDLLPQKTAEKEAAETEKIENELKFVPVQEEEASTSSDKTNDVVPEALITTPSADDVAKDALIQELTASPQEDILDQIIKEHQEQESQSQIGGEDSASGWIAAGAAAGLAGTSATVAPTLQDDKPETVTTLPAEELPPATDEQAAFSIATDKENLDALEPVFSADQMPEDAPASQPEIKEENLASLESLDTLDNGLLNKTAEQLPNESETELEQTTSPQELVPTTALAQESTQETDGFYLKDIPDTTNELETPVQAEDVLADSEQPAEEPAFTEQASTADEDVSQEAPATVNLEESVPVTEENAPATEEGIPATEEDAPATEEGIPATKEDAPATEEGIPATKEDAPATEEGIPATEEDAPASEGDTPVTEENIPASEEGDVPATEEDAPVTGKDGNSTEAETEHLLTEKDLQDAFGPLDEPDQTPQTATETDASVADENLALGDFMQTENNNPNELTEIELKAGSTYLISDFVPPAEAAQNNAETSTFSSAAKETEENKKQETIIQDMLTISNIWQQDQKLNADGLPENITATQVGLENNIQTKRGATFDIKTVPMVPDPSASNRLNVNGLDDLNAQHELKTSSMHKSTKIVIGSLVALLAAMVLYVLLGLVQMLPSSINIFANKEIELPATEQASEEFFPVEETSSSSYETDTQGGEISQDEVLSRVQNFNLPNGLTLKEVIEAKHSNISPDLITWEVAEAVEENSYVVTVKVPPENPQGYKTVYRYDYDMQTDMLNPTVSEAKNLLDQVSQQQ